VRNQGRREAVVGVRPEREGREESDGKHALVELREEEARARERGGGGCPPRGTPTQVGAVQFEVYPLSFRYQNV
jgi:hypothetical protein